MTNHPSRSGNLMRHRFGGANLASTVSRQGFAARRGTHATRRQRRGVILLVVMVLLAMFTMLGLTLVLVTAQGRLSALAAARASVESEHSEQMLDNVFTQVIAGSTDPNSVIGAHSLMEDLYGLPPFYGQISLVSTVPGPASTPVLPLGTVQQAFGTGPALSGQLMQFTVTPTDVSQNPANASITGQPFYPLPQYSGAFCGHVVTMLTGPAAGHSARVVGYYFDPQNGQQTLLPVLNGFTPPWAYLQTTSFDGLVPKVGDQFMVNGRPFSGTGFGFDLTQFQTGTVPTVLGPWYAPYTQPTATTHGPLLTALELVNSQSNPASSLPYAYLPNHSRINVTGYSGPPVTANVYWDVAGPGGANEPYDAPDFQNMMLAMHVAQAGSPTSPVVTPIPSLHRPELIGWWFGQLAATGTAGGISNPALLATRRKMILRPEPTDNYFHDSGPPFGNAGGPNGIWDAREPWFDENADGSFTPGIDTFLDLNLDGQWTQGETDYAGKTFNPITGCWYVAQSPNGQNVWKLEQGKAGLDVDNDQDGVPDSIWVDIGLQPQKESDGNYYKYLAAILCIDLDGKLNLNASGSLAQLDTYRYGGTLSGAFAGTPTTPTTTPPVYSAGQRTIPTGLGYGPADINLLQLFARAQGGVANAELFYQIFLQGYNNPGANQPLAPSPPVPPFVVSGRYGEVTRLTAPGYLYPGVYPSYSYPLGLLPPAGMSSPQRWFNGPRPGWSQWFDPYLTATIGVNSTMPFDWVNDPVSLARLSDFRPNLLLPTLQSITTPPFFFDFFAGTSNHISTAHGTPSDLHSRGFLARDISGRPYYASTAIIESLSSVPPVYPTGFPWQTTPANYTTTMDDFAVRQYVLAPYYSLWLDREQTFNEVVDSPYELDLTQNAAREGRNTGNSLNNVVGNDFTPIDDPLRPSELEGILRSWESQSSGPANSSGLVQRLIDEQTALTYANYIATGGGSVPAASTTTPLGNDNIRLAVTTESWDLPVPNISLTPRQIEDIVTYTNYVGPGTLTPGILKLNGLGIADLARARIFAENFDVSTGVPNPNAPNIAVPSGPDLPLFGNLKNVQQNVAAFPIPSLSPPPSGVPGPVWPLLAPEEILGMRLDVNRLLGNGQDDNGNGVIDEPAEATLEAMRYPAGQINLPGTPPSVINSVTGMNSVVEWLDLTNDGFLSATVADLQAGNPTYTAPNGILPPLPFDPTAADMRARQLLARHLYVTMMLILDDRSTAKTSPNPAMLAQMFLGTTATPPPATLPAPWPQYSTLSNREQAAYIIAQWAINVVDFRDRDSIMTPFEFDLYPFHADDPSPNQKMVTWNVDDVIGMNAFGASDDVAPYRGLVWGCERPELLMTETTAMHDRGTADTNKGQVLNANNDPDTFYQQGGPPQDNDYDQVRRPRGSLIVELFNPTNQFDAPQYDMQYEAMLGPASQGNQPWEKVDGNGNMGQGINLAQVATGTPLQPWQVTGATGPASSPVWRLIISYSPWLNESAYYTGWTASPYGQATPQQLDARVPALPPSVIHRAVYFTPYQPSFVTPVGAITATSLVNDVLLSRSFFADPDVFPAFNNAIGTNPAVLMVPPGQYALVAPASPDSFGVDTLYLGQNGLTPGQTVTNLNSANLNVQALQLGNQFGSTNAYNTIAMYKTITGGIGPYGAGYSQLPAVTSATVKQVIGVPIQTNWFQNNGGAVYTPHSSQSGLPGTGVTIASTLRMSVSEPERGYPLWPAATGSLLDDDVYYSQIGSPKAGIPNFPQHPFDSGQNNPVGNASYSPFGDLPNSYVAPASTTTFTTETPGMTVGYTMLYLQRLANPLAAWDANANPYLTVDSMPVDLTTYTGEANAPGSNWTKGEPTTGYTNGVSSTFARFDSRRRGYDPNKLTQTLQTSQPGIANIWTPLTLPTLVQPQQNQGGVTTSGTITAPLPTATLGYLNSEYGTYWTSTNLTQAQVGVSGLTPNQYYGDPVNPIPWITWNNRPYASQYELMLVPASSATTLNSDYGLLGGTTVGTLNNEFQPPPSGLQKLPFAQFAHLLNFFDSQQIASGTALLPNLYRVFEFLQVPSRFAGTQDLMNPTMFLGDNAVPPGLGPGSGPYTASHLFHPPFNWMSRFREPGKINLNTVYDPVVFQSLTDDYPGQSTLWAQLIASRYGQLQYNPLTTSPLLPNPLQLWGANTVGIPTNMVYPTYFANPFRPDGAGMLVPPTSWNFTTVPPTPYSTLLHGWNYPGAAPYDGANATFLRSNGITAFPAASPGSLVPPTPPTQQTTIGPLAMFDDSSFDTNNLAVGLTVTNTTPYRNAITDPVFQYQMFQRLGNTVTNRSNVYAIWITLGKFEVQPIAVSAANPDGYRLLRPATDPNGQQEKQRGFYVFDRSIPMGFQRGQNTNIEKGILIERVLQ